MNVENTKESKMGRPKKVDSKPEVKEIKEIEVPKLDGKPVEVVKNVINTNKLPINFYDPYAK